MTAAESFYLSTKELEIDKIRMPRLDEVELVVTNNLSRARARMSNSQYNDLSDHQRRPSDSNNVEILREEPASEDDHLLSPRKVRQR